MFRSFFLRPVSLLPLDTPCLHVNTLLGLTLHYVYKLCDEP